MKFVYFSTAMKSLLAFLLLCGLCPLLGQAPLSVKDGCFFRNGKPYRAVGINYHDVFLEELRRVMAKKPEKTGYEKGFQFLKSKSIPFARFAACGFFPREWQLYQKDPARYFAIMDDVVKQAEINGVGLIPSLFWAYFAIPDLVGESVSAWGEASSKTRQFMRQYTGEVVSRYKNSPAIWAWEFGNEYLTETDLPGPVKTDAWVVPKMGTPLARGEADRISSRAIIAAYRDFAQVVRSIDPDRPILTGDAAPRMSSWHLAHNEGWAVDDSTQWRQFLAEASPAPIDTICMHFYHPKADGKGYRGYGISNKTVPEMLAEAGRVAREEKKPLCLEEFGPGVGEQDVAARRKQMGEFLDWIVSGDVSLAAYWVFDTKNKDLAVWSASPDGENSFVFDMIEDANRRIQNTMEH